MNGTGVGTGTVCDHWLSGSKRHSRRRGGDCRMNWSVPGTVSSAATGGGVKRPHRSRRHSAKALSRTQKQTLRLDTRSLRCRSQASQRTGRLQLLPHFLQVSDCVPAALIEGDKGRSFASLEDPPGQASQHSRRPHFDKRPHA